MRGVGGGREGGKGRDEHRERRDALNGESKQLAVLHTKHTTAPQMERGHTASDELV